MNIDSNLKVIKSGNVPTVANLSDGEFAFGLVGGKHKLYGNVNGTIDEYGVDLGVIDVSYTGATNTLTIDYSDGTTEDIVFQADNFLSNVEYDPDTQKVEFTLSNDSTFEIDLADLLNEYEAVANGGLEIVDGNKFRIKNGGVTADMLEASIKQKLDTLFPSGDGNKVFCDNGVFQEISLVVVAI